MTHNTLPITVLIAVRNEEINLPKCLASVSRAARVVVLDSHSTDGTVELARDLGAEVVQFSYEGGYPKKRQWALNTLDIDTPWTMLLDADEEIPESLWDEIEAGIGRADAPTAFLLRKGFHFLGQRFRFGGFSFNALALFRTGEARFERLVGDPAHALDMEVHERIIVDGDVGRLQTPIVHDDFKGIEAYIDRHNQYSTWEAKLRCQYLAAGSYGDDTVQPRLFGNSQERRRALKRIAVRIPFEPTLWFLYHYVFRLGFLEGRPGLIASQIRGSYIAQVRAKMHEIRLARSLPRSQTAKFRAQELPRSRTARESQLSVEAFAEAA